MKKTKRQKQAAKAGAKGGASGRGAAKSRDAKAAAVHVGRASRGRAHGREAGMTRKMAAMAMVINAAQISAHCDEFFRSRNMPVMVSFNDFQYGKA